MADFHRGKTNIIRIIDYRSLSDLEKTFRDISTEVNPVAINTHWTELYRISYSDKTDETLSDNPLFLVETKHRPQIGVDSLGRLVYAWLRQHQGWDILSVTTRLAGDKLSAVFLVRVYGSPVDADLIRSLYEYIDQRYELDSPSHDELSESRKSPVENEETPPEIIQEQNRMYYDTPNDIPYLNLLESYSPETPAITMERLAVRPSIYTVKTISSKESFIELFRQAVTYLTTVEYNNYKEVLIKEIGTKAPEETRFSVIMDQYIQRNLVSKGRLPIEDTVVMKQKLNEALFGYYIIQDLLDIQDVTDIKITGPQEIIVRTFGKACETNVSFIDENDFIRFVEGLAIRNRLNMKIPTQTFTDARNPDFVLRFTITAPYVSSSGLPVLHIRKVSRHKLLGEDLIKAGMFDRKVKNYLLDAGKRSRGVVFAGPPGSGKTVLLNWFLEEAYEDTAELLIIQENDELFAYRPGVVIEHVVQNPKEGEKECSLEDLGKMALVAGCNVFIIGEARGGEICSAITLSNSGCRCALTIHSPSAEETIDKMADLALRGFSQSFDTAKRMIKSFETIVYLQDFKVKEIKQIIGYDEGKKDMIYKSIFRWED